MGRVLADQFTPALTTQHARIVKRLLRLRRTKVDSGAEADPD